MQATVHSDGVRLDLCSQALRWQLQGWRSASLCLACLHQLMLAMYGVGAVMITIGVACVFASRQKGLDKKAHHLAKNSMFAPEMVPVPPVANRSVEGVAPSL